MQIHPPELKFKKPLSAPSKEHKDKMVTSGGIANQTEGEVIIPKQEQSSLQI